MVENEDVEEGGRRAGASAGFGARLCAAREGRGLSLVDVADELKIRRCYLRALEEERLDELPARPFAIGFLRSYARLLELDGDILVRELKAHYDGEGDGRGALPAEPIDTTPVCDGDDGIASAGGADGNEGQTTLFAVVLFVIVALGVGAMVALPGGSGKARLASSVASAAPLSSQTDRPASLDEGQAPSQSLPFPAPRTVPASSARLAAEPGAASDAPPGTRPPSPALRSSQRAPRALSKPSPGQHLASTAHSPAPDAVKAPVLFRVRHDAWAMVEDDRGRSLWSGVIPAGSEWVPPRGARRFTTTHPANLELVVEGEDLGVLGRGAVPVQDLPLDVAGLRAHLKTRSSARRVTLSASADSPS
ncbi:MAG: hypothetical protein D6757_01085 [Alphaproteobacteria bacterium]|nr:MAG: hypothetical protein D6757_01085 [Alphaproteobacteria bacterium]